MSWWSLWVEMTGEGGTEAMGPEEGESHFLTSFAFVRPPPGGEIFCDFSIGCVGLTPALGSLSPSPPLLISAQRLLFTGHKKSKVVFLLAHCLSPSE